MRVLTKALEGPGRREWCLISGREKVVVGLGLLERRLGSGRRVGVGYQPTYCREGANIGVALALDAFKVKRGE